MILKKHLELLLDSNKYKEFIKIFYFRKLGEKPYVIPLGGSNYMGTFGIIKLFQELIEQVHTNVTCLKKRKFGQSIKSQNFFNVSIVLR